MRDDRLLAGLASSVTARGGRDANRVVGEPWDWSESKEVLCWRLAESLEKVPNLHACPDNFAPLLARNFP